MKGAAAALTSFGLAACGVYPLGDEGHAPFATEEQLLAFIETCEIAGARVELGELDGETDWTVAMGEQPQAKWNCLKEQQQQAGVMATTWGFVKEDL